MTPCAAPAEGMANLVLISPLPYVPHRHLFGVQSLGASPVPWIPICSRKPGSSSRPQVPELGRRCLTPASGAGAASNISMGSSRWSTLPWERCHLQCSP